MINEELMNTVKSCMNVRDTLPSALFNSDHQLKEEVKPALFTVGQFVVDQLKKRIPNIVIKDVYLQGSSASYLYKDKSDIDVQIEAYHPDIRSYYLQRLLDCIVAELVFMGYNFAVAGKRIDYCIFDTEPVSSGAYSLSKDKWVSKPQKRNFNFTEQDLYDAAYEQSIEAEKLTQKLFAKTKQPGLDELRELRNYIYEMKVNACHLSIKGEREYDINYCKLKVLRRSDEYYNLRRYIIGLHNSLLNTP